MNELERSRSTWPSSERPNPVVGRGGCRSVRRREYEETKKTVSAEVPSVMNGAGSVFTFPSNAKINARTKPKTMIASSPRIGVFQSQSVTPLRGSFMAFVAMSFALFAATS
jgi:hypothetical protein